MNLGKLKRRLVREVRGNPQKAGILALLVGVALYFWAPLIWGFISKENAPAAQAGVTASAGFDPAGWPGPAMSAASAPLTPVGQPVYLWAEVNDWMENSSATKAADLSERRDPFRNVRHQIDEAEAKEAKDHASLEITPASLGMAVTGTICGGPRRVAVINGKAYLEGETLKVELNGELPLEFTLLRVHPRGVLLRREGKEYEVAIPERKASGRFELSSTSG